MIATLINKGQMSKQPLMNTGRICRAHHRAPWIKSGLNTDKR